MDITWNDYTYELEIDEDEVTVLDEYGHIVGEARFCHDFLDPADPIHEEDLPEEFWDDCGVEILRLARGDK